MIEQLKHLEVGGVSEQLIIYEAGVRSESGKYSKFMASPVLEEVDDYISIMKETVSKESEILFFKKVYHLVCTTPNIIKR